MHTRIYVKGYKVDLPHTVKALAETLQGAPAFSIMYVRQSLLKKKERKKAALTA